MNRSYRNDSITVTHIHIHILYSLICGQPMNWSKFVNMNFFYFGFSLIALHAILLLIVVFVAPKTNKLFDNQIRVHNHLIQNRCFVFFFSLIGWNNSNNYSEVFQRHGKFHTYKMDEQSIYLFIAACFLYIWSSILRAEGFCFSFTFFSLILLFFVCLFDNVYVHVH